VSELAFFALPVLLVIGVFLFFRHNRRLVEDRFRSVAQRCGGSVEPAPWIYYPRLVVPAGDGDVIHVSGMHGNRNGRRTHTFAWLGSEAYRGRSIEIRRLGARVGLLERMGWERASTGDPEFDEVFWLHADAPEQALELLDHDVRRALLAFDPGLGVRLSVAETTAYRDGRMLLGEMEPRLQVSLRRLPPRIEDIEQLIAATKVAHARLSRGTLARSA